MGSRRAAEFGDFGCVF